MDFLLQDMSHGPFWIGVAQIILVNIILSGDNAVVIAMACLTLPPKQRLWGMILGAGVAVLLRVIFTLVIAQAMTYPYLKLVGGALLLWIAADRVNDTLFGGANSDPEKLWSVRAVVFAVMMVAYAIARSQWHIEQKEV